MQGMTGPMQQRLAGMDPAMLPPGLARMAGRDQGDDPGRVMSPEMLARRAQREMIARARGQMELTPPPRPPSALAPYAGNMQPPMSQGLPPQAMQPYPQQMLQFMPQFMQQQQMNQPPPPLGTSPQMWPGYLPPAPMPVRQPMLPPNPRMMGNGAPDPNSIIALLNGGY